MQYFYHVDLVTRNTTKFVSTNLEKYNSRSTFYKLFNPFLEIILEMLLKTSRQKRWVHPDLHPRPLQRDRQAGPSGQPAPLVSQPETGDGPDRLDLTGGEVATVRLHKRRRTRWYYLRGQRTTRAR